MNDQITAAPVEQLSVRNQLVVFVDGKDRYYPLANLDLTFETSDEEILRRANLILQEEIGLTLPESYVVLRFAETGNIGLAPKTPLGAH